MKRYKFLFAGMTVGMLSIAMLSGCGAIEKTPTATITEEAVTEEVTAVKSAPEIIVEEDKVEARTGEAETEISETKAESQSEITDGTDGVPTAPLISAEEAQKIADTGMEYVHTNNASGIIQDTTYGECVKVFAHSSEAEELGITDSDEDLTLWLETQWTDAEYYHDMRNCYPFNFYVVSPPSDDGMIIVDDVSDDEGVLEKQNESSKTDGAEYMNFFNFQCVNPVPMTDIEVKNINGIIKYMTEYFADEDEQIARLPEIIDGYVFDIKRNDDFQSDYNRMFVVRTTASEDKYKLDLFYAPYARVAAGFVALSEAWEETE